MSPYSLMTWTFFIPRNIVSWEVFSDRACHPRDIVGTTVVLLYHLFNSFEYQISMAQCKTAVSPLLTHWRYCSLAQSHWYKGTRSPVRGSHLTRMGGCQDSSTNNGHKMRCTILQITKCFCHAGKYPLVYDVFCFSMHSRCYKSNYIIDCHCWENLGQNTKFRTLCCNV